jgi:hypothetical protein
MSTTLALKLHAEDRTRELYIFRTNNKEIQVIEQPYAEVRRKYETEHGTSFAGCF